MVVDVKNGVAHVGQDVQRGIAKRALVPFLKACDARLGAMRILRGPFWKDLTEVVETRISEAAEAARKRGGSQPPLRLSLLRYGSVIVPDAVMIAPAARLTRPVPLPVAPANLPVPPTIVCAISRNCGAFGPAADEFPGEITPTMLS